MRHSFESLTSRFSQSIAVATAASAITPPYLATEEDQKRALKSLSAALAVLLWPLVLVFFVPFSGSFIVSLFGLWLNIDFAISCALADGCSSMCTP